METTLEYLTRMHKSLKNNYKAPDGFFAESCLYIAGEVARRLIIEGKKPNISWVGRMNEEGKVEKQLIVPKRYGGQVKWACHLFAVCDEKVFDPLIEEPVSLKSYRDLAFDKNCSEIKVFADYEEVLKRIRA
jgi:hypothetical protein